MAITVHVVCTSKIFKTWTLHRTGIWCGNCGHLCGEAFIFSSCIDSSVTSIFLCIVLQVFIIWIRSWCSCSWWWVLMWGSGLVEQCHIVYPYSRLDIKIRIHHWLFSRWHLPPLGAFYVFHLLYDKQQSVSGWRWC